MVVRDWEVVGGEWGVTATMYGVTFGGNKNIVKLIVVMVTHSVNILQTTELCILNG